LQFRGNPADNGWYEATINKYHLGGMMDTSNAQQESTITEMLRKALGAQRAGIVAYLREHMEMQSRELATAIESGMDLRSCREPVPPLPAPRRPERARTLEPVTGPDPRD